MVERVLQQEKKEKHPKSSEPIVKAYQDLSSLGV